MPTDRSPEKHVSFPAFGVSDGEEVHIAAPFLDLLKRAPVLKLVEAKLLMLETYEKTYGIYEHDNPRAHPLAHVLMHWSENVVDNSLMHERLQQFIKNQVHKHTGLSWLEFLEFQPCDARDIIMVCEAESTIEAKTLDEFKRTLGTK